MVLIFFPDEIQDTRSSFEAVACSSQSQVAYGYDENGKEVAIAIIFDGNFNGNQLENAQEMIQYNTDEAQNAQWIGFEEECGTTRESDSEIIPTCEADVKFNDQEKEMPSEDVVKVYKVANRSARKVKQLQKKVLSLSQKKEEKKMTNKKKAQIKFRNVKKKQQKLGRRFRRHTEDKAYVPPQSIRRLELPSKFYIYHF